MQRILMLLSGALIALGATLCAASLAAASFLPGDPGSKPFSFTRGASANGSHVWVNVYRNNHRAGRVDIRQLARTNHRGQHEKDLSIDNAGTRDIHLQVTAANEHVVDYHAKAPGRAFSRAIHYTIRKYRLTLDGHATGWFGPPSVPPTQRLTPSPSSTPVPSSNPSPTASPSPSPTASMGPTSTGRIFIPPGEDSGFLGYGWHHCAVPDPRGLPNPKFIFFEDGPGVCGGEDAIVGGFALVRTYSFTSHLIEVCNYRDPLDDPRSTVGIRVESANPDGSGSGYVIEYDAFPGHCYKATKGYPMHKFRATFKRLDFRSVSGWSTVPPA